MFRREGMLSDQDVLAGFEKFVNQQCRRLKKEQVRIEIGHTLHLRRAPEHMTRQEGRQGPAILGDGTARLHAAQRCVLQFREPDHRRIVQLYPS